MPNSGLHLTCCGRFSRRTPCHSTRRLHGFIHARRRSYGFRGNGIPCYNSIARS